MGCAGRQRRYAAKCKACQRTAIGHQLALSLHHMNGHRRLTILEGGELLGACHRNGGVARDDLLDQAAHGLQPQRERNDIQQQHLRVRLVAHQHIGLDGGTDGHHLVRIDTGKRRATEEVTHPLPHQRHPGRTTHHHHLQHLVGRHLGILERPAAGLQRLLDQRLNQPLEQLTADGTLPAEKLGAHHRRIGQLLLDGTGQIQQLALLLGRERRGWCRLGQ